MSFANTKTFLLFQPDNLFSEKPIIELRQLIKTPEGITTEECAFSRANLKTWFKNFNDQTLKSLTALDIFSLAQVHAALQKQAAYLNNSKQRKELVQSTYRKHLYSAIATLRRQPITQWYHPVSKGVKRVQNQPCQFYDYPVELSGKAQKEGNREIIQLSVEIGRTLVPLQDFRRHGFLLEKDNCYYQLSPKSDQALNWLNTQLNEEKESDKKEISPFILEQLSQWINVKKEYATATEIISTVPQPQVLLSEISNSFLKLEPQFVYEGVVIDGSYEPIAKTYIAGKPVEIHRDKEKEEELTLFLRSLHENFSNQNNGFFYLSFADAQKKMWFLKTYHLLLEKDIDLKGVDMLKHFRYSPHTAETIITNERDEADYRYMEFSVKFGREKISLPALQKALLNGQKAVMLKDGSLGILGEDWLQQYGLMIKHSKVRKNELQVARWLSLGEVTESNERLNASDSNSVTAKIGIQPGWFSKWKQWEKNDGELYALPAGLQVETLRPYQRKGYEWLRLLEEAGAGACLADDMGLGKTLQVISFLLYKIEANPEGKHLVIAPASLLYNWQKELEKFAPNVTVTVLHGTGRDMDTAKDNEIIITSYGTMRQDVELLEATIWETIVLDESHHIKNPQALTTRAAWQLTAKTKIALSGTPVMNGTADLHSQMHFVIPGLLGAPEFFKKEYTIPIEQQGNTEKAAVLQKLIRPFLLRRTKEQVAKDLPARTESVLWCEMSTDQRYAYETVKESIRTNIFTEINAKGLQQGKLGVLAGLTKLRQLCNSAELVQDEDLFTSESVKTKILINELKCIIPQHRALVFSQFTSMLDLLERDLNLAGIATLRLDGQTPIKRRQELVNEFQSEESQTPVFLISLKAGNSGLTLTRADYVFLFDPWWNTSVESQAIDRTHRIGQQQQVFAYRMICRNSIEEKIIKLAGKKKKLSDDLIVAEESLVKGLTMEDLTYLLE